MTSDVVFRGAFASLLALFVWFLTYYGLIKTWEVQITAHRRLAHHKRLVTLVNLPTLAASAAYLLAPASIQWAMVPIPVWLRWCALILGAMSMAFYVWIMKTLGQQWSVYLTIREGHQLVDKGPYRYLRHPMYTLFFAWTWIFFLLSANWLIGGGWLCQNLMVASRLREEESLLIEHFGDDYRRYMRRSGRFLPRLKTLLPHRPGPHN